MSRPENEVVVNKKEDVEDEEAVVVAAEVDSSSDGLKKGEEVVIAEDEETIDPVELYPVREFHLNLFKDPISFNPLVSAIGCFVLWGLSIWCMGTFPKDMRGFITFYD